MFDTPRFLEKAQSVFELAGQLGDMFEEVDGLRTTLYDPSIWDGMEPTFRKLRQLFIGLQQEIMDPQAGLEAVAEHLREAAEIARSMQKCLSEESHRDVSQDDVKLMGLSFGVKNPGPVRFKDYHFYARLQNVAQLGKEAVRAAKAQYEENQFSFLDEPNVDDLSSSVDSCTDLGQDDAEIINSADCRSVRWFGEKYSFTETQAYVVERLLENYRRGTPDVGSRFLFEAVDHADSDGRMSVLFRGHPAWQTMIILGGTRGSYRIADRPQRE